MSEDVAVSCAIAAQKKKSPARSGAFSLPAHGRSRRRAGRSSSHCRCTASCSGGVARRTGIRIVGWGKTLARTVVSGRAAVERATRCGRACRLSSGGGAAAGGRSSPRSPTLRECGSGDCQCCDECEYRYLHVVVLSLRVRATAGLVRSFLNSSSRESLPRAAARFLTNDGRSVRGREPAMMFFACAGISSEQVAFGASNDWPASPSSNVIQFVSTKRPRKKHRITPLGSKCRAWLQEPICAAASGQLTSRYRIEAGLPGRPSAIGSDTFNLAYQLLFSRGHASRR